MCTLLSVCFARLIYLIQIHLLEVIPLVKYENCLRIRKMIKIFKTILNKLHDKNIFYSNTCF